MSVSIQFLAQTSGVDRMSLRSTLALLTLVMLDIMAVSSGDLGARYIGCYRDNAARVMGVAALIDYGMMTPSKCLRTCAHTAYFGLEAGCECYCANNIDSLRPADNCIKPCFGSQSEICGGDWALSVYYRTMPSECARVNPPDRRDCGYGGITAAECTGRPRGCCYDDSINGANYCFYPDIDECASQNGGCQHHCHNTYRSYHCSCRSGYNLNRGGRSCDDINECADQNGGCQHHCHNTDGGYYCSCPSGFELSSNRRTCVDIDECAVKTHDCSQGCINTHGSYNCYCWPGYNNTDRYSRTCIDINECDTNKGGCEHTCHNTPGSYHCSCQPGFILNSDKRSCDDLQQRYVGCFKDGGSDNRVMGTQYTDGSQTLDLCWQRCSQSSSSFFGVEFWYECYCADKFDRFGLADNCNTSCVGNQTQTCGGDSALSVYSVCQSGRYQRECNATCNCQNYTTYGERCWRNGTCPAGCKSGWTGIRCETDIDECATRNGSCDHRCHNTPGSYHCSCRSGFNLNSDKRTCDDIDECAVSNGNCSQGCNNIPGSYNCYCWRGYNNIDIYSRMCIDIDECATQKGGCEYRCHNTDGSYHCSCQSGFKLNSNNKTCVDINECAIWNGGCQQHCINTDGSYHCSCDSGYTMNSDNKTCSDINECAENKGGCQEVCSNTIGSFRCECPGDNWKNEPAYRLRDDSKTCENINECVTDNGGCEHYCHDKDGDFGCSCRLGYQKDIYDELGCTATKTLVIAALAGSIGFLVVIGIVVAIVCVASRGRRMSGPKTSRRTSFCPSETEDTPDQQQMVDNAKPLNDSDSLEPTTYQSLDKANVGVEETTYQQLQNCHSTEVGSKNDAPQVLVENAKPLNDSDSLEPTTYQSVDKANVGVKETAYQQLQNCHSIEVGSSKNDAPQIF